MTLEATKTKTPAKMVYTTVVHAEHYWIDRARSNIYDYMTYISDGQMRPADHQLEWLYYILSPQYSRVNLVAPRGSGKTDTLIAVLSYFIGKKPWLNNFIGCVNPDTAFKRLAAVRDTLLLPRYKNVFPWIEIDNKKPNRRNEFTVWSSKWKNSKEAIGYIHYRNLVRKYGEAKGSTMYATGVNVGTIVGQRFTGLVVIDDAHDDKNSATEDQRQKVVSFLDKTLTPCLVPTNEVKMIVIGTRWAETDLIGVIKERVRKNGAPVWHTLELAAYDEDGSSYWPEVWPVEKLEERREEIEEPMFQLAYMNNPLGLSSGEFSIDMLRNFIDNMDEAKESFKEVLISVDLAISTSVRADYTVFGAVARDRFTMPNGKKNYNYYVLELERGKYDFNTTLDKLALFADDVFEKYGRLDGILFEKQGFQEAWGQELKQRRPDFPIKQVPLKGDKDHRLKAPAMKAQEGRMYINEHIKHYQAMCSELISFPGKHDDICDVVALPFQYWGTRAISKASRHKAFSPFAI